MKKNYQSMLILVILLFFLFLSIIQANNIISYVLDYSSLFLTKLFPVSFIFLILSNLLMEYGLIERFYKAFHINASGLYVFLISIISGFPAGAKCVKDLLSKQIIDIKEANQMIMFSHFPNPLFIFGAVSSMIQNQVLTRKLYLAIILSNFFIFISQKHHKKSHSFKIPNPNNFSYQLSEAITQSSHVLLLIYGTSLFFYLLLTLILSFLSLPTYSYVFLNGIFDLTKGVFTTSLLQNNIMRIFFILFFIQFGGISIHMQVKGILSNSSVSYLNFIKGRIISTILAFIILIILILWK